MSSVGGFLLTFDLWEFLRPPGGLVSIDFLKIRYLNPRRRRKLRILFVWVACIHTQTASKAGDLSGHTVLTL